MNILCPFYSAVKNLEIQKSHFLQNVNSQQLFGHTGAHSGALCILFADLLQQIEAGTDVAADIHVCLERFILVQEKSVPDLRFNRR